MFSYLCTHERKPKRLYPVPPSQAKSEKQSKQINDSREYITLQELSTLLGSGGSAIKQQVDRFSNLATGNSVGEIAYCNISDSGYREH